MVRIVKQPEERREDIIEAARGLFLSKGYEKTTMKDIMVRLNIAKGTIYHYFNSKEQLLDAVTDSIVDEYIEYLVQEKRKLAGNGLERLTRLLIAGAAHEHDSGIIDDLHHPANSGLHIRLLAKMISRQAPVFAELIEQGCSEGIFKTDHPVECLEFLFAGIQFLTDLGIYSWPEEALNRRVLAFPGIIEANLGAPKGSFDFVLQLVKA